MQNFQRGRADFDGGGFVGSFSYERQQNGTVSFGPVHPLPPR